VRFEVIVNSNIGSSYTLCFSLDSAPDFWKQRIDVNEGHRWGFEGLELRGNVEKEDRVW
jgi:hypothetical protein